MNINYFLNELLEKQLISNQQKAQIEAFENTRPMSVHWELRALLYAGIVLFTSGIGILIYQNIDSISHDVLIGLLALITAICFWHVLRQAQPFSTQEAAVPPQLADFVLLLGCLLFLALEGYVQYQYNLFGKRYGLATAIPAVFFLFLAYRFDHRGVLSMALTALASWVGLSVAPLQILKNDFGNPPLIYTAVAFSMLAIGTALFLDSRNFKKHFTYTYLLLLGNLFFVAALAGLFSMETKGLFFVPFIAAACFVFMRYARAEQSFLFLLMAVLYGYIAFTNLFYKLFDWNNEWAISLVYLYFIISAVGVVWFFLNYRKLLGMKS